MVQAVDTLTLQRGAHLLKSGVDLLYNRVTITFPGALQGLYTFPSLAAFQRGAYSQFQQSFGVTRQFQSNPNLGLFVQDEWRLRSDLTVTAGFRYDLQWLPEPIALDTNNVSPRLGVAYAPGAGRTVVRASAGVYFDRIPLRATSNALQRDGSKYKMAVLVAWPGGHSCVSGGPAGISGGGAASRSPTSTRTSRPAATSRRRCSSSARSGSHLSATVGYSYLRGHGIIMSRNVNVPTLTAAQAAVAGHPESRPAQPELRQHQPVRVDRRLVVRWPDACRWRRAPRRGAVSACPTRCRSALDTAGNAFFQTPQDNFDILGGQGTIGQRSAPPASRERHVWRRSGRRAARAPGRAARYVFSYASAAPFNAQAGVDLNNDTTINDRPPGVGRNAFRLPCYSDRSDTCGTSSLDLRLSRAFRFGRHQIELMAEAFNLLNRVNVVNVNNNFGAGSVPTRHSARSLRSATCDRFSWGCDGVSEGHGIALALLARRRRRRETAPCVSARER